jgi:hypothetical protein
VSLHFLENWDDLTRLVRQLCVLIRQLRRETKEKILADISKMYPRKLDQNASFEDKCKLVSDDLQKPKSMSQMD